jgi:hypothetical protein
MAAWPSAEELRTILNLEGWDTDDVRYTTTVPRALATAIAYVKLNVGSWVEGTDSPDDALANAALTMGRLLLLNPGAEPGNLAEDPTFRRSMYGHRRRFGIA